MKYPGSPVKLGHADKAVVEAVQTQLNALRMGETDGAAALRVDGDFGPATDARVRLFQARGVDSRGAPLEIDGVLGPESWAALFGLKPATVKAAGNDLLNAVISVASGEVGVLEQPLGSNRGPKVDLYIRAGGLEPKNGSYAWCAAFLCWVFGEAAKQAGVPNPLPRQAGVMNLWRAIGAAGLYRLAAAEARAAPQLVKPGMLFFLSLGDGLGHVGLVKSVSGVALRTIEGNTTDKTGSREGIGVFERTQRRIPQINLGFADVSRKF